MKETICRAVVIALIAALLISPISAVLSRAIDNDVSTNVGGLNADEYIDTGENLLTNSMPMIIGQVVNPAGLAENALVLVANMDKQIANYTWAINGTLIIDAVAMVDAEIGNEIKLVITNYVCVATRIITWNNEDVDLGVIVLDPIKDDDVPELDKAEDEDVEYNVEEYDDNLSTPTEYFDDNIEDLFIESILSLIHI